MLTTIVRLGCSVITQSECTKYLGWHLNEELWFHQNISSLKRYLFLFLRKFTLIKQYLIGPVQRQIYFASVYSKLIYGLSI